MNVVVKIPKNIPSQIKTALLCHLHSLQLFRKLRQEKNVSLTLVIEILINIRKSVKMTLFQQKIT